MIGKQLLARIGENIRNVILNKIDENYKRKKKEILSGIFKKIKLYGIYKLKLIKNLQKFWKNRCNLSRLIKKTNTIRKAIKYVSNKEFSIKQAYSSIWRLNVKKIKNSIQANKLQKFYLQILDFQRYKRYQAKLQIEILIKRTYLRKILLQVFKNLKNMKLLKKIHNLMFKIFFKFFKIKTNILNA